MAKKLKFSFFLKIIIMIGLLIALMITAVCIGKYPVSPLETVKIIFCNVFSIESGYPLMTENVVLGLRLPRIFATVLVGASLSLSGCAYQGVFKNPLVSPDFLGVSGGACIGAALGIIFSLDFFYIQFLAFLGGIIAVAITMLIPILLKNKTNIILVLSGVIVGSAASSLLGFIKYIADPATELAAITYWTMGNFSYIKSGEILFAFPLIAICTIVLFAISWRIDILSLGENEAKTLGVNIVLIRNIAIICSTLLTAISVCLCGTIGWIGLVIPHFARLIVGANHSRLLPFSALIGGIFMLFIDTLTRTIGPEEMPVSILTGIIGAPFYIILLFKQQKEKSL